MDSLKKTMAVLIIVISVIAFGGTIWLLNQKPNFTNYDVAMMLFFSFYLLLNTVFAIISFPRQKTE